MDIPWRKSSFSNGNGNCIETAAHGGGVLVRESDEPEVVVRASRQALAALLAGVKEGSVISK